MVETYGIFTEVPPTEGPALEDWAARLRRSGEKMDEVIRRADAALVAAFAARRAGTEDAEAIDGTIARGVAVCRALRDERRRARHRGPSSQALEVLPQIPDRPAEWTRIAPLWSRRTALRFGETGLRRAEMTMRDRLRAARSAGDRRECDRWATNLEALWAESDFRRDLGPDPCVGYEPTLAELRAEEPQDTALMTV